MALHGNYEAVPMAITFYCPSRQVCRPHCLPPPPRMIQKPPAITVPYHYHYHYHYHYDDRSATTPSERERGLHITMRKCNASCVCARAGTADFVQKGASCRVLTWIHGFVESLHLTRFVPFPLPVLSRACVCVRARAHAAKAQTPPHDTPTLASHRLHQVMAMVPMCTANDSLIEPGHAPSVMLMEAMVEESRYAEHVSRLVQGPPEGAPGPLHPPTCDAPTLFGL